MARKKDERSDIQKAEHRREIATLYLRGTTQMEIAARLGISQATVCQDLKAVHAEWRREMLGDFDQRKARELARIDALEQEAWDAWRESKKERLITSTKKTDGANAKNEAGVRREKRDGAVQYLAVIQWAIEQRCKIFGFYAPTKLSIEEMDRIIDRLGVTQERTDGDTTAQLIN